MRRGAIARRISLPSHTYLDLGKSCGESIVYIICRLTLRTDRLFDKPETLLLLGFGRNAGLMVGVTIVTLLHSWKRRLMISCIIGTEYVCMCKSASL